MAAGVARGQPGCGHGDEAEALVALAIFAIAHRFIDLRHVGVSVDRVGCKDTGTEQRQKCRDCFNHFEIPLG
jgi:hypothetical protein